MSSMLSSRLSLLQPHHVHQRSYRTSVRCVSILHTMSCCADDGWPPSLVTAPALRHLRHIPCNAQSVRDSDRAVHPLRIVRLCSTCAAFRILTGNAANPMPTQASGICPALPNLHCTDRPLGTACRVALPIVECLSRPLGTACCLPAWADLDRQPGQPGLLHSTAVGVRLHFRRW